ncbi:MAG: diguanylate cyclase [Nitrospirae bacterium]|nr:MAG: diguanylate cyclase [Nitrospirota bacterium]
MKTILNKADYSDVILCGSADEAFKVMEECDVDLILMDVMMPGVDGIEACRRINEKKEMLDIPIIMVTAKDDREHLQRAFSVGALDYVTKPFDKVELLARVRSALKLKCEMDKRKARERELEEMTRKLEKANAQLRRLSSVDGLTGVANRRTFDETLSQELKRAVRSRQPISLVMIDVDYFKLFNDTYGHQKGDDCLKSIAGVLKTLLKRPGDLPARYGGEEFACILAGTSSEGASKIVSEIQESLGQLNIPHEGSPYGVVTISAGIVTAIPDMNITPQEIIRYADEALYMAKRGGRNAFEIIDITKNKEEG